MISKHLVICGNARPISEEELKGYEIWALGTSKIVGADRYYELHGLPSAEPTYRFKDIPIDELHAIWLPLSNSICIMVAHAVFEGRFESICVRGSPLRSYEYRDKQADLAFICGWAKGKGVHIYWEGSTLDIIHIYMDGKDT